MNALTRFLNALLILIITGVLASAFGVQLFFKEQPCVLCFIQRMAMTGVAVGALFNLLFGIKPSHYGISLIAAVSGAAVALRQIALHVCPGLPPFGEPVLGLSLYVWSFIVFTAAIAYIAFLLLLYVPLREETTKPERDLFANICIGLFLLVTLGNIATVAHVCGFGFCD
jgi:disulfide bond formation protein DsbB